MPRHLRQRSHETLTATFGGAKLTYLVNNAGIGTYAYFADTTPEQMDQLYRIHMRSPYILTQSMLPHMADGGGSAVRLVRPRAVLAARAMPPMRR